MSITATTMRRASESVLNTVELVELILLRVDARTLLISSIRVSRLWNSLIGASPHLQRALFFLPQETTDKSLEELEPIQPKVQNPFLKDVFPAWFRNSSTARSNYRTRLDMGGVDPTAIPRSYHEFEKTEIYKRGLGEGDNPFLRPTASWRRMLTSQPPCLIIATVSNAVRRPFFLPCITKPPGGLRMGDLYGMTLHHAMTHRASEFTAIWVEEGSKGYLDMVKELFKATGGMLGKLESSARLLWMRRPDLILYMTWNHAWPEVDFLNVGNTGAFWERCGSNSLLHDYHDEGCGIFSPRHLSLESTGL